MANEAVKSLPGQPDLVFPRLKKIIFIHGCFWHQHPCKRGQRIPASNRKYWLTKLRRNKSRDRATTRALHSLGYQTLIIWECQIKNNRKLQTKIERFLNTRQKG